MAGSSTGGAAGSGGTGGAAGSGGTGGSNPLPLLGVYNGGPNTDDDTKTTFGKYPDIASTYYQPNQASFNVNGEKARVDKGIRPLITITSKNTTYLVDIAAKSGPGWTWINDYVNALKAVSDYAASKNVDVYATFEHEWEVKVNQGILTGGATAPATYAKALSNFIALTESKAPKIITVYWYGGFDVTDIAAVGSQLSPTPDMYTIDPYSGSSHPATETFEQMGSGRVSWLKSQSWYKGEPIGFSEFGAQHSDADMAKYFFKDVRQQSKNLGLAFAVFFNRFDDGFVVPLTQATYPLSTAAFSASLAAN
ncbi:MAG: hypothetical protein H6717_30040 [Polyangiaceae bacterium]|nr:hypothetical protein [Polyangiaceae bacterium]